MTDLIVRTKYYVGLLKSNARHADTHGVIRQLLEMLVVFLLRRIGPGFYLMAEMGKLEHGWAYKLGFYNGREYVRRVNKINNPDYYSATFNKVIEKSVFNQFSIPTPKFLGFLGEHEGYDYLGNSISNDKDLGDLVEKSGSQRICFKLLSEFGGRGFRAAEVLKQDGVILLRDLGGSQLYRIDEYVGSLNLKEFGGYLIEEYFHQHRHLNELNSTSVNTLRVMVYKKVGQKAQCLGAFLKIGRYGKLVDNGMEGGILAKVDLQSTKLEKGLFSSSREFTFIDHPDSKTQIEGFKVPFFDDSVELACRALDVFPGINFAGVDVAVSDDGPVIIELNARADHVDFAIINVPSKSALC